MRAKKPDCLGGLPPATFLRRHWQKRPLLVRGAFPGFTDPVTPEELAGLACEADVESRLVLERDGTRPWQVLPGPQNPGRFRRLPRTHWSLLVQGVDRLLPRAAELMDPFRFIPDWRLDDVMVSFAPRHGSVGPHVDNYDVFLLQGRGRRRWRIDTRAAADFVPGLDLRILRRFRAEREWVLGPGDMLYLPPGVAHHGVALEDCLTYSIGFRAPSVMDLLAAAVPRLAGADASGLLYRDPGLRAARHPGEIPAAALKGLRTFMDDRLRRLPASEFASLAGEVLTEPKDPAPPPSRRATPASLRSRLARGAGLERTPGSRWAFVRRNDGADLFADGRRYPLGRRLAFAAPLLTDRRRVSAAALAPHRRDREFLRLLTGLTNAGLLRPTASRP
jgi:50S ribosomal protein L16 3-hydroxylase